MHENLRNAFSIKPEHNQETSKWQHLRSDRTSLSFFALYSKIRFKSINGNFAEPDEFSILIEEFKEGTLKFGFSSYLTELDLIYDTDIEQPVYYLKITLSPLKIDNNVNNIKFKVNNQPLILKCDDLNYVNNFKNDIENQFSGIHKNHLNINYLIYVDIEYINTPPEEDAGINLLNLFKTESSHLNLISAKIFSAGVDIKKGTITTDRCRPVYVNLIP